MDGLFYIFAGLALICGFLVVANPWSRNPVTSALFLVLTMVWLSGLYVLLNAYFLAAVQILVYAGAVMVLFLFVIMLMDPKEENRRPPMVRLGFASVTVLGLFLLIVVTLHRSLSHLSFPATTVEGNTASIGRLLFTQYLLPFEMISVLLLVAMMGVVLLSKKERK